MLHNMDSKGELTNVPDYQKIRQTTQSGNSTGWNEEVETLVPSPVVRPPVTTSSIDGKIISPRQHDLDKSRIVGGQQHKHQFYGSSPSIANYPLDNSWEGTHSPRRIEGTSNVSKASWESQGQSQTYNYTKYNDDRVPNSATSGYIPQGYARPVTKYIDANGVERRFIRRTVSPNRRSFTEGLLSKSGSESEFRSFPTAGALRNAASQKNLAVYQDHSLNKSSEQSSRDVQYSGHFPKDISSNASRHTFASVKSQKSLSSAGYPSQQVGVGGGGDDQWKQIGGSHMSVKAHQEGLRHWQQQHQEELLHQHLETQALYESPSNQSVLISGQDNNFSSKISAVQEEPPARWEPVRRVADNIIQEKNMIINKLKNRILELEDDFKDSESKLRQALISREDDADIVKDKLQELQHSNATLKERLNEERAKKNSEIDDLELKLGSAEHEIQKLKESIRNKSTDTSNVQSQLTEKTQEAALWHDKFRESCESHQEMKKKLDSLQRYLDELPTVEESHMQHSQILSLREENVALKSRNESLDKKLSQVRKVVTSRDFRIKDLEEREKDLEHKIKEISTELEQLRDTEGSEFYNTQQELSHVKAEKERMAIDLEKAKKLLEANHQRLRQQDLKYQGDLKSIQERLLQEEEMVTSLRQDLDDKDNQISKMRKSMKDLGVQNQEQLEQNLLLKQQLRQHEESCHIHHNDDASSGSSGYSSVYSSSSVRANLTATRSQGAAARSESVTSLQAKLMKQLGLCISELLALVNVCSQRARGEDPDISVLLGVKSISQEDSFSKETESSSSDQGQTLTQWLNTLGEQRKQVDRLRADICNKYAEDMGNNITCATQ